jgi:hypothetical protein
VCALVRCAARYAFRTPRREPPVAREPRCTNSSGARIIEKHHRRWLDEAKPFLRLIEPQLIAELFRLVLIDALIILKRSLNECDGFAQTGAQTDSINGYVRLEQMSKAPSLYSDFGNANNNNINNFVFVTPAGTTVGVSTNHFIDNVARAGVNYRF